MRSKFTSIIISIIILFLITVAVYKSYTPNSKTSKESAISDEASAASISLPETALETAANEATGISTTTAAETTGISTTTAANETINSSTGQSVSETIETTTEVINKNLPTLKLIVYEGPIAVPDSDLSYYRVEARVTGNPAPFIKFSRDDSNGVWGKNRAQINLKNGESYDLVVTAVNSVGSVKKHIILTLNQ